MEKGKKRFKCWKSSSVAVHLIMSREKEIKAFVPEEYWSINGEFLKGKDCLKVHSMV